MKTDTLPNQGGVKRPSLTPNTTFRLLLDERRRQLLRTLTQSVGTHTVTDLVDHLQILEGPATPRGEVECSLLHVHLPILEEAGVVQYDTTVGTVKTTEKARSLDPYLELAAPHDR
ncbi:hypothetical protein OB919_03680 [Halobacteria archaeon AArc-curdl1]|uniref:DUF7344 domain-containing protein n=1 Tax=Natronosalvus hydrolyticus TaxID=2979988 RepID=A0AAP2Z6J8_9EURY|nr:hypothetical protein [Halobacteria archaeon AArc-curdl1]